MRTKMRPAAWGLLLLGTSLALTAAIVSSGTWWSRATELKPQQQPANTDSPPAAPGFIDVVESSGIDFRSEEPEAEKFNLNLYDHGCGLAVADFDGDGDDDVLFLNQLGANGLYRNLGGGRFEHATNAVGPLALPDRICVGAAFADYDNDGDQDLYVTSTHGGNVLFENDGKGRYRDVTERAGVGLVAHSQTPTFFDYDND
ncbi:MAG: FG-GAP repeat domain-containing protein, partial [Pirellulales bacterium]